MGLTQDFAKRLYQKDSPKTLGRRVSCETGTGLGGQRARLDEHRATHMYTRLGGYWARLSLVGISAHCM